MSAEDQKYKLPFSAAEVAAYLRKRQESQKEIDRTDQDNRYELWSLARIFGEAGQEQILKHYEFAKATPEEQKKILAREQEKLWREEPFTATSLLMTEIINKRIIPGGAVRALDILNNENFELSAYFVDSTSMTNNGYEESWQLIFDRNYRFPDKRRVAIRSLSNGSKRLGNTMYQRHLQRDHYFYGVLDRRYDNGVALLEDNTLHVYGNERTGGDSWDRDVRIVSPQLVQHDEYIATMRSYLENCVNNPDQVKLTKWRSPQLKQRMKEMK